MAVKKQVRAKTRTAKSDLKVDLKARIHKMNTILVKLEGEFEKAVKGVLAKGEKSSHEIRRGFDEIVEWVKNGQVYAIASGTTENLRESFEAELNRVSKETVERIRGLESVIAKGFLSDARGNILGLLDRLQANGIVENVKEHAQKTRGHILEVLQIPDQTELDMISSKVGRLEKKIQSLSLAKGRRTA